jgi:hypothetical protein
LGANQLIGFALDGNAGALFPEQSIHSPRYLSRPRVVSYPPAIPPTKIGKAKNGNVFEETVFISDACPILCHPTWQRKLLRACNALISMEG